MKPTGMLDFRARRSKSSIDRECDECMKTIPKGKTLIKVKRSCLGESDYWAFIHESCYLLRYGELE